MNAPERLYLYGENLGSQQYIDIAFLSLIYL